MKFIEFSCVSEVVAAFPTEQSAIDFFERLRWDGNVVSPFDPTSKVYKCKNNRYRCKSTSKYFTVRTGTIMSDSKVSLAKWILAMFLFGTHKKGLSSYQLVRYLGVQQKAGWFMLHRMRYAMSQGGLFDTTLSGIVESDTAFLGGKEGNKHEKDRSFMRLDNKAAVVGMVQRGGNAVMTYVPTHSSLTVAPLLAKNIKAGSRLMTDEGHEFAGASKYYVHDTINHGLKEYSRGDVTTNTVEGAWAHLKRNITGTYHFTSKKHLQAYLDEFTFRYNRRKLSEYDKTIACAYKSFKGSLKWNDLIGKGGAK